MSTYGYACILAVDVTSVFQALLYTTKKLYMKLKQKTISDFMLLMCVSSNSAKSTCYGTVMVSCKQRVSGGVSLLTASPTVCCVPLQGGEGRAVGAAPRRGRLHEGRCPPVQASSARGRVRPPFGASEGFELISRRKIRCPCAVLHFDRTF